MALSALRHIEILEELEHTDIIISLKSARRPDDRLTRTVLADRKLAERGTPYALHLGITEARVCRREEH